MEHKAGTLQFKENWKFETVNKETGEILDTQEFCNLIMDAGRTRVAELINGVSSTYFRAIAVGTGTTAENATQTALVTEQQRATATLTNGAMPPYTAIFSNTFSFGGSYAITEAGIFDNATSGGAMLSRVVMSPAKNVTTVIQLIVTATITVA